MKTILLATTAIMLAFTFSIVASTDASAQDDPEQRKQQVFDQCFSNCLWRPKIDPDTYPDEAIIHCTEICRKVVARIPLVL